MTDIIALARGLLFRWLCKAGKKKVTIGSGLRIYSRLSIVGGGKVVIGRKCSVYGMIGTKNFVCLQTFAPSATITIGDNASLYAARIASKFSVTIGDDVVIEDANIIDTDFHSLDRSRATPGGETLEKNRIIIGSRVGVGAQSFITKGVIIGDDALIAPCSVVAKSVECGNFAYGNPLVSKHAAA